MHKPATALLAVLLFWVTGCVGNAHPLPYESWRLGFLAPDYMEVWIETADAVDIRGRAFLGAMTGMAAVNTPERLAEARRGWPNQPGAGAGKQVPGADLPRLLHVRWQSLAEPQVYEADIVISEATRQAMVQAQAGYCPASGKWSNGYRNVITVGLAPGGVTKVWLMGACLDAIEVARVQASVVAAGPDGGQTGGQYALPLKPESKSHIEKYGIPYGSW